MTQDRNVIAEQIARWSAAERAGSAEQLAPLLDERFVAVGPLGFVLDKQQWTRRFNDGLKYNAVDLEDVNVRQFGDTAVLVGRHVQAGSYQGRVVDGAFRTTQVWVQGDHTWRLASLQLSPIAPPPGSQS